MNKIFFITCVSPPFHRKRCGRADLLREEFCRGDAGLLPRAVDRSRTSLMGHYYGLHRIADVGRGVAEQKPLPAGRDRGGGLF